jgi:hypothetical protein
MLWASSTAQSKTATINKSGRLSEKARLARQETLSKRPQAVTNNTISKSVFNLAAGSLEASATKAGVGGSWTKI